MDPEGLTRPRVEHRRGTPTVDGDGHVAVAVLVEDHVARPRVGERARGHREVPLAGQLELDARPRDNADLLDVLTREIQRDVAETVDVEQGGVDRSVDDLRLREVEPDEAVGIDGWPELRKRDTGREVRRRGGEEVAAVERPGDRVERVGGVRQLVRLLDPVPGRGRQEKAVVRADVEAPLPVAQRERAAGAADAGIDDREVDVVLAFVPEASMGTAVEMWEAYTHGRAVITVSPLKHNWAVKFLSHEVYADLDELEAALLDGRLAARLHELMAE